MHRGGLSSPGTSLDSSASSPDCTYGRLFPDTGMKTYERAPTYHEPKSATYDLPRPIWINETVTKCPVVTTADHSGKPTYETRSYAEAKCHAEVSKYHEMTRSYHHHDSTAIKYSDLQTKSYDLPKSYPEAKGYSDGLKYSTEMSGVTAKTSYTCVHGQYYPAAEGYTVHGEETDYQSQSVSSHPSFYPYISASMTQPPYYMGPR